MRIALRKGMLTVEREVAAPAEAVWNVLVDLDAWPLWGPTVAGGELIDADELALGVRGTVLTPLGVSLPFTIIEFEPGRSWKWEVAGLQATRHEVEPHGDGSILRFGVPLWAPAYLPVCAIALPRIEALARPT
jgi:uncharacterized protein YndB with AHSA1/START domain